MSFNDFGDVINKHQPKFYGRPVFFAEDTAPEPGRVVCFDRTYTSSDSGQASTDPSGFRCNRVKYPTSTNHLDVGGVISHTAFGKAAKVGGQWCDILVPGSTCMIRTDLPVSALNTVMLTAAVNAIPGVFLHKGFAGRGSAIALQVLANLTSKTAAGPGPIFQTTDGSATYTASTKTVGKTGIGQYAVPGDRFVCVTGSTTGGAAAATAGDYTVATVPNDNSITLTTAPLSGDGVIAGLLVRGKPKVQALLLDGLESGLIQYVNPLAGAAASPVPMQGGTVFIGGGYTCATASTAALADGPYHGLRQAYAGLGTLTTAGIDVTVDSGLQADDATALAGIVVDAATEFWVGEWIANFGVQVSGVWFTRGHVGATLAAT